MTKRRILASVLALVIVWGFTGCESEDMGIRQSAFDSEGVTMIQITEWVELSASIHYNIIGYSIDGSLTKDFGTHCLQGVTIGDYYEDDSIPIITGEWSLHDYTATAEKYWSDVSIWYSSLACQCSTPKWVWEDEGYWFLGYSQFLKTDGTDTFELANINRYMMTCGDSITEDDTGQIKWGIKGRFIPTSEYHGLFLYYVELIMHGVCVGTSSEIDYVEFIYTNHDTSRVYVGYSTNFNEDSTIVTAIFNALDTQRYVPNDALVKMNLYAANGFRVAWYAIPWPTYGNQMGVYWIIKHSIVKLEG